MYQGNPSPYDSTYPQYDLAPPLQEYHNQVTDPGPDPYSMPQPNPVHDPGNPQRDTPGQAQPYLTVITPLNAEALEWPQLQHEELNRNNCSPTCPACAAERAQGRGTRQLSEPRGGTSPVEETFEDAISTSEDDPSRRGGSPEGETEEASFSELIKKCTTTESGAGSAQEGEETRPTSDSLHPLSAQEEGESHPTAPNQETTPGREGIGRTTVPQRMNGGRRT